MNVITTQEALRAGAKVDGDCYQRAFKNLTDCPMFEFAIPVQVCLCHGTPLYVGNEPELIDRPFEHAWIEVNFDNSVPHSIYDIKDHSWYCIDAVPLEEEELRELVSEEELAKLLDEDTKVMKIVPVPRHLFYEVGRINILEVQRYSTARAMAMAMFHGTYGPWEQEDKEGGHAS